MNHPLLSLALLAILAIGCTTQPIETRGPCPWNTYGPECEMQILSDAELDAEQRRIERLFEETQRDLPDAIHDADRERWLDELLEEGWR